MGRVAGTSERDGGTAVPLRSTRTVLAGLLLAGSGLGLVLSTGSQATVTRGQLTAADIGRLPVAGTGGQRPVHLDVPDLAVHATVVPTGRTSQGALAVPASFTDVGWWRGGSGLGVDAPVVLVGHVDDHHGPAVFGHLNRLRPGAQAWLTIRNRRVAYVVDAVRQYDDNRFPTALVYGATARPTLRLITCGGYSWWRRAYQANVVVFAHLA